MTSRNSSVVEGDVISVLSLQSGYFRHSFQAELTLENDF